MRERGIFSGVQILLVISLIKFQVAVDLLGALQITEEEPLSFSY